MTGTGFIKCIPITISGLVVTAAISVIEIDEVLLAMMVSSGQKASRSLKIFSFKSRFSVAASTTKLAYSTPVFRSVKVVMLLSVFALSASEIFSLATIRSRFLAIVANPRSREALETSINCTL